MAGENGTAGDLYTVSEAARLIGEPFEANAQMLFVGVRTGKLPSHGELPRSGSQPASRLVSLPEARAFLQPVLERRAKAKAKAKAPKPQREEPEKAKRRPSFAREEVRHFAQSVMVELLHASSITITERPDGTFEVVTVPRVPAPKTFTV